jgi:hypothetical protein
MQKWRLQFHRIVLVEALNNELSNLAGVDALTPVGSLLLASQLSGISDDRAQPLAFFARVASCDQ